VPKFNLIALACVFTLLVGLFATSALAATKTFHANGKIQSETTYNGDKISEVRWYDETGALQSVEAFVDAQTKVITFYAAQGQKKTEETHVGGKRVKMRTFFPNGNIESEYSLKNDQPDGKYLLYYENGKLKAEFDYKDGKQI